MINPTSTLPFRKHDTRLKEAKHICSTHRSSRSGFRNLRSWSTPLWRGASCDECADLSSTCSCSLICLHYNPIRTPSYYQKRAPAVLAYSEHWLGLQRGAFKGSFVQAQAVQKPAHKALPACEYSKHWSDTMSDTYIIRRRTTRRTRNACVAVVARECAHAPQVFPMQSSGSYESYLTD